MLKLPKILYVLRTLSIPILKRIFNLFHKQMNNYVWQNKKPRLSLALMNKHLCMGRLGLPNLQTYHLAVTLDKIKHWWHNSDEKSWLGMEAAMLGVSEWRAVLLDPIQEPLQILHTLLSVHITLQYWKQLCGAEYVQSGHTHVCIPLSFIPLHIPDIQLDSWRDKGIISLEDLYDGAESLQQTTSSIPRSHIYLKPSYLNNTLSLLR